MRGFILENMTVEISDTKVEKIHVTEDTYIDGTKYKTASAQVKFISTGDVSGISSEELASKLSDILSEVEL